MKWGFVEKNNIFYTDVILVFVAVSESRVIPQNSISYGVGSTKVDSC